MSNSVRDTFLAFLRTNLDADIPIHNVRRSKDDPDAHKLRANTVNIEFDGSSDNAFVSWQQVFIDVLNDDDRLAQTWIEKIRTVLKAACQTPHLDYTDPDNPTPVGGNVFWERTVKFRPVRLADEVYSHSSAMLTLNHQ